MTSLAVDKHTIFLKSFQSQSGYVLHVNFPLMCQSISSYRRWDKATELSETEWLRDSLVFLHSAVAEWVPATTDNYPTMPEGSLGSQREVTHCYARADRKGLLLFQCFPPAQYRQGWRDGGGRGDEWGEGEFAFSFSFQLAIVCKLNFKKTNLSI